MKNKFLGLMLMALITLSFTVDNEKTVINESNVAAIVGCGSAGNKVYGDMREGGMSHRQARRARRSFVRWCRAL